MRVDDSDERIRIALGLPADVKPGESDPVDLCATCYRGFEIFMRNKIGFEVYEVWHPPYGERCVDYRCHICKAKLSEEDE